MGNFLDWFLGGSNDDATKAQIQSNREARKFIEAQARRARNDVLRLFPKGTRARGAGYGQALQTYRKVLPEQLKAFQQGNIGAQRQLQMGQGSYQDAILGRSTPPKQQFVQPQRMNPNLDFIPRSLSPDLQGGGGPPLTLSGDEGGGGGGGGGGNDTGTGGGGGDIPQALPPQDQIITAGLGGQMPQQQPMMPQQQPMPVAMPRVMMGKEGGGRASGGSAGGGKLGRRTTMQR